jgi:hypothetical protein
MADVSPTSLRLEASKAETTRLEAKVANEQRLAQLCFPILPREITRLVFLHLPVDARLLARGVCPEWCAFLEDCSLWQSLDFSDGSGIVKRSKALLKAASARACGLLQVLDVSGWKYLTADTLLSVARENAEALLEVRAWDSVNDDWPTLTVSDATQIFTAALRLQLFQCDLSCTAQEAPAVLSRSAPFEALQIRLCDIEPDHDDAEPFSVDAFLAAAATHGSLKNLHLHCADLSTAATLDSLVDLAIARSYTMLCLSLCRLPDAPLPALTRLINEGSLEWFGVRPVPGFDLLADAQSVPAFFDALKRLQRVSFWYCTFGEVLGRDLLQVLSESSCLKSISLEGVKLSTPEAKLAFGEALARLLLKTATLEVLFLNGCCLSTEALQSRCSSLLAAARPFASCAAPATTSAPS